MKTKLLRKIRKRFKIKYYPLGIPLWDFSKEIEILSDKKYSLEDKDNSYFVYFGYTKEDCLNAMMKEVRKQYAHRSRKNKSIKELNKPVNVWYENKREY